MYKINEHGGFEIENFQNKSEFASMLSGISGLKGLPIWAYYVNRGQGIASFGIENKDSAIQEFSPADKAYENVSHTGFRSFLLVKAIHERDYIYIEPFAIEKQNRREKLTIYPEYIELETLIEKDILIKITYTSLPNSSIGALVRNVCLINQGEQDLDIKIIDGLTKMLPPGVNHQTYQAISNTLKSWFNVQSYDAFLYYELIGQTDDVAKVSLNQDGNFFTTKVTRDNFTSDFSYIYDKELVFGYDKSYRSPLKFITSQGIDQEKIHRQVARNQVSSAYVYWQGKLASGGQIDILSLYGYSSKKEHIVDFCQNQFIDLEINQIQKEMTQVHNQVLSKAQISTANPLLDLYYRQSYLDNGLRGGFPITFSDQEQTSPYYVYSRKHGDLERDYNDFLTSASYYSQGNGNFRDINQNRRMDNYFNLSVKDTNIHLFTELIQLDGFNPLGIGKTYYLFTEDLSRLKTICQGEANKLVSKLWELVSVPFEPGDLYQLLMAEAIDENQVIFNKVLIESQQEITIDYKEGYWLDHWTYILDLIDNYISIYPDLSLELFTKESYRFYHPKRIIKAFESRIVETERGFRQYEFFEASSSELNEAKWTLDDLGYPIKTNLLSKLILLATIKIATIGPRGMGLFMEGGKPGWNDALNGLPALFGSSSSELFELSRLLNLIKVQIDTIGINNNLMIKLPHVAIIFMNDLYNHIKGQLAMDDVFSDKSWLQIQRILASYREKVYTMQIGQMDSFNILEIESILEVFIVYVNRSIEVVNNSGINSLVPTYYQSDLTWDENCEASFNTRPLSLFLEGNIKKMKLSRDKKEQKAIYRQILTSSLFDHKLKMFKVNVPLDDDTYEIGRIQSFSSGWLENASIFMHLEFKYILEILKAGLYDEFYEHFNIVFPCFMDANIYGRNILENSTFIASSVNPNDRIHGKGFVARLTGANVEVLNIIAIMFLGKSPFEYKSQLEFKLNPILNGQLFDDNNQVSYVLFGTTKITYVNPLKCNTYGSHKVKIKSYQLIDGQDASLIIYGDVIIGEIAEKIRLGTYQQIIVNLA